MTDKIRKIISVFVGVVPFVIYVIIRKLNISKDISVLNFLGWYFLCGIIGLGVLYFLIKYFLKENIYSYFKPRGTYVLEISLACFLLISVQFIYSLANVTYVRWINESVDKEQIINILVEIFNSPISTIFFLGPFIWIMQFYMEFSRVFLLKNLWDSHDKVWTWLVIIITAAFFSLIYIDNGLTGVISGFFISLVFNIIYYRYKRILPLIFAGIFTQLIGLIEFYVRMR